MRMELTALMMAVPGALWAADTVAALEGVSRGMAPVAAAVLKQQGLNLGCEDLAVAQATSLTVLDEPRVAATGEGGRWVVRYAVAACGQPDVRSLLFDGRQGPVAVEALTPGGTLADPALQRDVRKSFALAVARAMPRCPGAAQIVRTQVVFYPKTPLTPWREVWIGRSCGHEVGQVVEFTPAAGGTRFRMAMPESRRPPEEGGAP